MKTHATKLRRSPFFVVLCALVVMSSAGVFARSGGANLVRRAISTATAARPEIKVALAATVARDDKQITLDDKQIVRPGEILTWTITSQNTGTAAAQDYATVGQIPQGTSFVQGSASAAGTTVTYSIDNGKTFVATPTIAERQADGTVKQVPAPVTMYTQVRYEWADPLAADARLTAAYKVRVR